MVQPTAGGWWQVSLKAAEATTRWEGWPSPSTEQSPQAQSHVLVFPDNCQETLHSPVSARALGKQSPLVHSLLPKGQAALSLALCLSVTGAQPAALGPASLAIQGLGGDPFCCPLTRAASGCRLSLEGCWAGRNQGRKARAGILKWLQDATWRAGLVPKQDLFGHLTSSQPGVGQGAGTPAPPGLRLEHSWASAAAIS